MKSKFLLYHRNKLVAVVKHLEQIYMQNESTNERHMHTMKFYSIFTLRITQLIFVVYFLSVISFLVAPFIIYLVFNVVELIVPIYIPYVNVEESVGFIVTSCFHIYFLLIAGIGFALCDTVLANLIFQVLMCSALIGNDLDALNEMLLEKQYKEIELTIRFRNLLQMHKELRM